LNPRYVKAYFNRAEAYLKLGQDHRATDDLNKAVSLQKYHEEMNQ
jgi:Tfp pilus assembly protein PilF